MTRDEFEALLEEAFIEGYNNAYDEIEEVLNEDYIEIEDEDMDSYNEESGHKRLAIPSYNKGLIKGARLLKDAKRLNHDLRKVGIANPKKMDIHNQKDVEAIYSNPKARELAEKYYAKGIEKSMKPKIMGRYMKSLEDKQKKFDTGKLKDLKTRVVMNRVKNEIKKYKEND